MLKMQVNTQEDNSMSDRILTDIERIFNSENVLDTFSIIPTWEIKNKSPVVLQDYEFGLESWCVKHVYRYVYVELFKARHSLKSNRLSKCAMERVNKLLLGALLLNPDVSTFWNMRRELVENEMVNINKELMLTKLVLSNKSKSNEAFAYRKWILYNMIKNLDSADYESRRLIIDREFALTEMAANKSQNNYHAWTHRVWSFKNISCEHLDILLTELESSLKWVSTHVSEHSGFYYRQHLFTYIIKNRAADKMYMEFKHYYKITEIETGIEISPDFHELPMLQRLLGNSDKFAICCNTETCFQSLSSLNYLCLLMFELFHTIDSLNNFYPGHEAIWYHHRFVMYHLLKFAYDYHGLSFKTNVKIDDKCFPNNRNVNILDVCLSDIGDDYKIQENGEKYPKLLKYETNKVESCDLYKILVKYELQCIKKHSINLGLNGNYDVQSELAKRHEKWLRHVLCLNGI